jgi:hypothetical protein
MDEYSSKVFFSCGCGLCNGHFGDILWLLNQVDSRVRDKEVDNQSST